MKSFVLLLITGFTVLSTALPSFDLKFQSLEQKQREEKGKENVLEKLMEPHLPRYQPVYHFWKWGIPHFRLTKFKWTDCGNSSSKVIFKDFKLSPDPIVLPGSLKVSGGIEFKEDIPDRLRADIELKKIIDTIPIEIPCISNFGSCDYKDLCSLLSQITECPDVMNKNKIPCHCPFKKGSYFLPLTEFKIPTDPVPSGFYTLKAILSHRGEFVGCLSLGVGFSE